MGRFRIFCRFLLILIGLEIPGILQANVQIETVYLVDISSSMLELYGTSDHNLLKDVLCFIKSDIENLPDDSSAVTLVIFATGVKTVNWQDINPKTKTSIYQYLDKLADSTRDLWETSPESLSSTYITQAILTAFHSLKTDPFKVRQTIYLFSDGELLIPPDVSNPIDYQMMIKQLTDYNLSRNNLRVFNYFPLFIDANIYLKQIIQEEGGEIFEHVESDLCNYPASPNELSNVKLTVKDHLLLPFPNVTISSPRLKSVHLTDSMGVITITIKSPLDYWYPFSMHHTGYADTYTHAYIDSNLHHQDTIRLVTIMMTPVPIRLNFTILDQDKNTLTTCSLRIESPRRTRNYLLSTSPASILYYDYTPLTDTIRVILKRPSYQDQSLPLLFNTNQNEYHYIIEMEKLKI